MDPFQQIRSHLSSLRTVLGRAARREALLACLLTVVAGGALGLAWGVVGGVGPGRWGWVAVVLGLLGAGWAVWSLWLGPRRQLASDERLARWLEARVDGLESGVITGVQSEIRIRDLPEARLGFSPALARSAAGRTAAALEGVSPATLVDPSRQGRLAKAALALTLGLGLVAIAVPEFYSAGVAGLVTVPDPADEADATIVEVDVAVGDLGLEVIYPPYVGLAPRTLPHGTGDVAAVPGSEVRFTGVALHPAVAGVLIMESEPTARWAVDVTAEGLVRGRFRVGAPDRYRFLLATPDGEVISERQWRKIEARSDLEPEVTLLLPEADVEVHDGDEVALLYEALDDYGLDRIVLVITPDAGGDEIRKTVLSTDGERSARGTDKLSVAGLGLEPGRSVTIHFEAIDRNDVSGPGIGRSAARKITMYSPEAEHEALLGGLEELMDALLDLLADRLESPVEEQIASALQRYVALHDDIARRSRKAILRLEELVGAATADPMASDDLKAGLRAALQRLQEVHEQEQIHLRRAVEFDVTRPEPRVIVALLASTNEEVVGALEETILDIKSLVEQSRQDAILDQGRELLDLQADIQALLEQLKNGDPEAAKEAQRKLDQLQQNLQKMQQQMAKMAETVPYENTNPSTRPNEARVDMAEMAEKIAKARQLIKEGRIEEAMKLLEELNTQTQQVMAVLQDGFAPGRKLSGEARQAMNDFQQQLGEVADVQRGLRSETDELEGELRQQLKERLADRLAAAKEKAEAIEQELGDVDRAPLHEQDAGEIEGLRDAARRVAEALEQGDVEGAAEQARELGQRAGALKQEIGEAESRESDEARSEGLKDAMKQVGAGATKAEELAQDLEGMIPKPGEGMSAGQRGRSQKLQGQQRDLGGQLRHVREQLEALDQKAPGTKEMLEPLLEGAQGAMERAGEKLGEGDMRRSGRSQQEALEQLEQASEEMEQRMRSQRPSGDDGAGVNDPERKVGIPGEEDFEAPDFREELLKAMKERAPERYKEEIKRYYEELIK